MSNIWSGVGDTIAGLSLSVQLDTSTGSNWSEGEVIGLDIYLVATGSPVAEDIASANIDANNTVDFGPVGVPVTLASGSYFFKARNTTTSTHADSPSFSVTAWPTYTYTTPPSGATFHVGDVKTLHVANLPVTNTGNWKVNLIADSDSIVLVDGVTTFARTSANMDVSVTIPNHIEAVNPLRFQILDMDAAGFEVDGHDVPGNDNSQEAFLIAAAVSSSKKGAAFFGLI